MKLYGYSNPSNFVIVPDELPVWMEEIGYSVKHTEGEECSAYFAGRDGHLSISLCGHLVLYRRNPLTVTMLGPIPQTKEELAVMLVLELM